MYVSWCTIKYIVELQFFDQLLDLVFHGVNLDAIAQALYFKRAQDSELVSHLKYILVLILLRPFSVLNANLAAGPKKSTCESHSSGYMRCEKALYISK